MLWRATGRPESANLVAYASIPLFAWFLARAFRVPWQLTVIGLLAVPLIQIHATSAYVDLPANAAASVVVLLAIRAHATRAPLERSTMLLAAVSGAVAANMKVMMGPLVLLALVALGAELARQRRTVHLREKLSLLAISAVVLAVVFATPLKNAWLHQNPWYPVRVTALGIEFTGPEEPYSFTPAWLLRAPKIAPFFASVLEIGLYPYSNSNRWSIDQFMPAGERGARLGGFFGLYVVALLIALTVLVARDARAAHEAHGERRRRAKVVAIAFSLFTLVIAFMPQSLELRYYMCWMIVLVALTAWMAQDPASPEATRGRWLFALSFVAFSAVVAVMGPGCLYPSGVSFAELKGRVVDAQSLARIPDGGRVCVDRAPWNILFVAKFHPPRRYAVQEAESPADCRGAPPLE